MKAKWLTKTDAFMEDTEGYKQCEKANIGNK